MDVVFDWNLGNKIHHGLITLRLCGFPFAKIEVVSNATFLTVAIYFDIVASAKFYCNEISGVEAKIVFKCNAYFLLQYTLIIATRTRKRG
jgi:hypothetical protein